MRKLHSFADECSVFIPINEPEIFDPIVGYQDIVSASGTGPFDAFLNPLSGVNLVTLERFAWNFEPLEQYLAYVMLVLVALIH